LAGKHQNRRRSSTTQRKTNFALLSTNMAWNPNTPNSMGNKVQGQV